MSSIFNEAPPFRPIDRVAMRITRKGEHWDPQKTRTAKSRDEPMIAPPADCQPLPSGQPDITGMRRGRMVAHCYMMRGHSGRHLWVARCDCGHFEIRRLTKFVKRASAYDCCARCDEAHFARTGTYLARRGDDA